LIIHHLEYIFIRLIQQLKLLYKKYIIFFGNNLKNIQLRLSSNI